MDTYIYNLWRTYVTVLQMLKDRKFRIDSDGPSSPEISFDEFVETFDKENEEESRKALTKIYESASRKLVTIWWDKPDVGNAAIQGVINQMNELNVHKAILVIQNKITPYAHSAILSLRVKKIAIETFFDRELIINPTHHDAVPRHIICSAKTKALLLEKYAVTKDQIPQIKSTDVIVRYFGATKGQLFKILRPSDATPQVTIAGEKKKLFDITYRIVN